MFPKNVSFQLDRCCVVIAPSCLGLSCVESVFDVVFFFFLIRKLALDLRMSSPVRHAR